MRTGRITAKVAAIILLLSFVITLLAGCSFFQPKLNGVSIGKYTIVYDKEGYDYNLRAAEYIQSAIKDAYGVELEIIGDEVAEGEHEIVVGETSRKISNEFYAECEGFEFAVYANDSHIALEGNYFIIAAAAYYFTDTYIVGEDREITVPKELQIEVPIMKEASNFIMLIGDGMGLAQTRLYDVYDAPTEGGNAFSDGEDFFYGYLFPALGYSRTDSLDGTTDSAAGGTALSSGYKTHNTYIGRDGDGNDVRLITELAASLGKATAVMSTEKQTGATPASFSAHAEDRNDTSDISKSQIDIINNCGTIIECGYDYYTQRYMTGSIEKRVTDTLSKLSADEDGFFLMYEEAHIDKHCHNNDSHNTFLAIMRFNQVIARFMEFAFYNPDTFVLITADHETGGLSLDGGTPTYSSEDHTSANVPVFAYGMGCDLFAGTTVENVQIPKTIAAMMGVNDFGRAGEFPALTK